MLEADYYAERQALVRKLHSIAELSLGNELALLDLPMTVEKYPSRQELVEERQRPGGCHLILDGFACRHKSLPDGRRQILSFHTPGDIPDLEGMHLKTLDYGVSTLVPSVVGHIAHATLHDLARRHLAIAQAFWRDTMVDAAIFREWLLSLGQRSAREHLAHLLCETVLRLEAVGYLAADLPLTLTDLADALGLPTVQVNRELQDLQRNGLIELRARGLRVLDFKGLAGLCDFDRTYLRQEQAL